MNVNLNSGQLGLELLRLYVTKLYSYSLKPPINIIKKNLKVLYIQNINNLIDKLNF